MTEHMEAAANPRGRQVALWLQPDDYARLEALGARERRKVASMARAIVLDRLDAWEAEHGQLVPAPCGTAQ